MSRYIEGIKHVVQGPKLVQERVRVGRLDEFIKACKVQCCYGLLFME